jgi:hypothetical protein
MKKLKLSVQEFYEIKSLLLLEGINYTYKIVKGVVIVAVPYFFVAKYGY